MGLFGDNGWIHQALEVLRDLPPTAAFFAVLGMLFMCGLGLPVPEDIILITAGFLAAMGKYPLWVALLLGMGGVLSGDGVMYMLGRRYGVEVFEHRFVRRLVSEETLEVAREKVVENARFICFIARFMPGFRSPVYLTAGAMGVPPRVYLVQDGLAASLSVPLWVVMGWWFGERIDTALVLAEQFQWWIIGGVGATIAGYVVWRWTRNRRETPETT